MTNRIKLIIKDGNAKIYSTGDFVVTTATQGDVLKGDDGNYYRTTIEVIDGVATPVLSASLGTSV